MSNVSEAAGVIAGGSGDDRLIGSSFSDTLSSGEGNDTIVGNLGDDVLIGGAGDDMLGALQLGDLSGDSGSDYMDGGDGNDFLSERTGDLVSSRDTLLGGAGDDAFLLADPGPVSSIVDGGGGVDTVWVVEGILGRTFRDVEVLAVTGSGLQIVTAGIAELNQFLRIDDLRYCQLQAEGGTLDLRGKTNGSIALDASQVLSGVEVVSTRFSDYLNGTSFSDFLAGLAGNDAIMGGGGNDTLAGGSGDDEMSGGAGDDEYHVDSRGDVVTEAADEGTDTIRASLSWSLGDNVEHLVLTGKGGTFGDGNALDNTITGNRAGNVLSGKDGDDTLNGRMGADKLWGGAGDDVFVLDTTLNGRNVDRIGDFGNGDDTIQLGSSVFTTLGVGALAASAFQSGDGSATTADARILYNSETGTLTYDADGSGSAPAVQFAILKPGLALTADDFVVV